MTKCVKVKNLIIGGDAPISVQSMINLPITEIDKTLEQIKALCAVGCDIVRVAIPNKQSAQALAVVRSQVDIPLVADIHFDYRLAIAAMECGADKIRINPGNIACEHLDRVIDCAKSCHVPIRIGVNGGSVDSQILAQAEGDKCLAMAQSIRQYVNYFEDRGFGDIVLSVKSSNVQNTITTNRLIATLGYPIHLGVTEAGLMELGIVKNAIGIGSLLVDGIGNTIRVSLTADPVEEVVAANNILRALQLKKGVQFVSCPKCGRCTIDLQAVAQQIYDYVKDIDSNVKIAVMGCEVNGPGECKDADLGIAGANGKYVFFKQGKIFKTVSAEDAVAEFKKEIDLITNDN